MVVGFPGHNLEAPSGMAGLRHDSSIVPAGGQQIGHLGVGLKVDLVGRTPRRHMIAHGADGKDRHTDVGERDRLTCDGEALFREIIVEEELAQIFRMHAVGHAGGIGIPRHQVGHR